MGPIPSQTWLKARIRAEWPHKSDKDVIETATYLIDIEAFATSLLEDHVAQIAARETLSAYTGTPVANTRTPLEIYAAAIREQERQRTHAEQQGEGEEGRDERTVATPEPVERKQHDESSLRDDEQWSFIERCF